MPRDAFSALYPNDDQSQRIVSAEITRDNNDVTVGLWVKIPSYDIQDQAPIGQQPKRTEWGPCPWRQLVEPVTDDTSGQPLCRIVWPRKGWQCWVAFDQEDRPTVYLYWPPSYERLPQTEK